MRPNVLVIASNERFAFQAILRKAGCLTLMCSGYREALDLLQFASVVICEDPLPDGSWLDVLRTLQAVTTPPALIVTSRLADDRLWAEVLNRGGDDVLAQPLREEEVIWAVQSAHRRWQALAETDKPDGFGGPGGEAFEPTDATERKEATVCLFGQASGGGT